MLKDEKQKKIKNVDLKCFDTSGSLHHIAFEMLNYSSPVGSSSRKKLKHVLDQNQFFYIDLGPPIFSSIQESLSDAFIGYGLRRSFEKPTFIQKNITLVETIFTKSSCPIIETHCHNQTRILLQTEQYLKPFLSSCHQSPNCIIFEFSDYNYRRAKKEKMWGDSIVLLPIMHQFPSRLSKEELNTEQHIENLKPLSQRTYDIVFFGLITRRRKFLLEDSAKYKSVHPNSSILVTKKSPRHISFMADAYKNAKICLIAHSYSNISGGEYHRLTEFAEYGCIPVMEEFSDHIGVKKYEKCAHSFFTTKDHLFQTAENVMSLINKGEFDDFSHVRWWKKGIKWDSVFSLLK